MPFNLEPEIVGLVALGLVLLLLILWLALRKKSPKHMDDETAEFKRDLDDYSQSMSSNSSKKFISKASGNCEHDFEVTGFPPDKIGSHVILTCKKCSEKLTVTVSESYKYLRQRGDVRDAQARARGSK